ncbi:MAG: sulfatase [Armatimonadetes bacterium]|nr:sulfatase [Armatimonadota bacterium]
MPDSGHPNILQIICHDLGQHVGCLGAGLSTPAIDGLAADSVLFDTYCCSAAQCSPSRGSIMTGLYPHNNGLIGLAHIGWEFNEGVRCLPHYLNDFGYETHLFGGQHESARSERVGYQHIHACGHKAQPVAAAVAAFLRERASAGSRKPFYLNAGFTEPHRPYQQEGYRNDDPSAVTLLPWLPDRPGIRRDIADLNGLVYAVDDAVGAIRAALAQTGLDRDTLLIFTTDHGLAMPRAKGTCYDPGLKTVLIMRLPGRFEGGRRISSLLTNCDLMPTLLEFVGAPPAEGIDGRSFLPLLDGGEYEPRESIFAEMTWHDKYNPMRAIKTERWKYIRNFGERPLVYLPLDTYQGLAGREMRDEYYGSRRPEEELYDLLADPLEMTNLAGDPAHAGTLADLRRRVQTWMEETDDILLHGDVPPTLEQAQRIAEWNTDN